MSRPEIDPAAVFAATAEEALDWRRAAETGDAAAAVEALAALDPVDYDRVREEAAQALGCRVATLDREVARHRPAAQPEVAGSPVSFEDPEPWPEPVDPAALLAELEAFFTRHAVLPEHGGTVLPLWAAHTWTFESGPVTPRLGVTSPQKGCGKSTVLDLLAAVVRRPLEASHATTAALFRVVEAWRPTVLLDEADTYLADNEELRGLLNAGHHHRGRLLRAVPVGDDFEPRAFSVFTPVAIAAIGRLPGTLADRSIVLRMQRRRPGERVEPFRRDLADRLEPLRRRLARFALDHAERLRAADPDVPLVPANRAADNWRPLFAIADLAGGEWPARARAAALARIPEVEEDELGVLLLGDIRRIFAETGTAESPSTELCERLAAREDRPWPELSRGRPLTPRKLAALLRPFGILPVHREQFRGYRRADFEEAWQRYLPDTVPDPGEIEASSRQEAYSGNGSASLRKCQATAAADGSESGGSPGSVSVLTDDTSHPATVAGGSGCAGSRQAEGPGTGPSQSVIRQDPCAFDGSAASQSVRPGTAADTSCEAAMTTGCKPADGMTVRPPRGTEEADAPGICPSCGSARWWRPRGDVPWRCWTCEPPPPETRPGFEVVAEELGA